MNDARGNVVVGWMKGQHCLQRWSCDSLDVAQTFLPFVIGRGGNEEFLDR